MTNKSFAPSCACGGGGCPSCRSNELNDEFGRPSTGQPALVAVESPGGGRIRDKRAPRPNQIVSVKGAGGQSIPLHRHAAAAWRALVTAARRDGIAPPLLLPTSGFRDPTTQERAWKRALRKYNNDPQEARKWVAPPGHSAHQSGRAIDFHIGLPNDSRNVAKMRSLPVFRWLVANAARFGFYPYPAEPWHWEYNPPRQPAAWSPPGTGELSGAEWESNAPDQSAACPLCQRSCGCRGLDGEQGEFGRFRKPRRPGRARGQRSCPPGAYRGPFGTCTRPPAPLRDLVPEPAPLSEPVPTPVPAPMPVACGAIRYRVDPQKPFGPKWKRQRPPGLPVSARQTSAAGEARPHIKCLAAAQGLGTAFVNGILSLADNETGGTFAFALPANIFNALPEAQRAGRPLITAWGVFQFNNPAWRRDVSQILGRPHTAAAWECTPQEEIEYPIRFYAARFREVLAAGGRPLDAVRGMRLQHHGPGIYGPFLRTGRTAGFAEAWRRVPEKHRNPIQRSLTKWGFASN